MEHQNDTDDDAWDVADYNGTVEEEEFCPYWRCSERVDFILYERTNDDGECVEAEKRCPHCGRTIDWARTQNRKTVNNNTDLNRLTNAKPTHGA